MLRQPLLALRTAHPPIATLPHQPVHSRTLLPRAFHTTPKPRPRWPSAPSQRLPPLNNHLPIPKNHLPRRPFTTSTPHSARNTYNRFNSSSSRPSLFHTLISRSKPHHFILIGLGLSGVYLYNTEVVEMTGRRRFNCVSHAAELKMGEQSYREVLAQSRGRVLPDNHPLAQMVNRVLQRLIPQVEIEGADWRVHVIVDDGNANAFVLPGFVAPFPSLSLLSIVSWFYADGVLPGVGARSSFTRAFCQFVKTRMALPLSWAMKLRMLLRDIRQSV